MLQCNYSPFALAHCFVAKSNHIFLDNVVCNSAHFVHLSGRGSIMVRYVEYYRLKSIYMTDRMAGTRRAKGAIGEQVSGYKTAPYQTLVSTWCCCCFFLLAVHASLCQTTDFNIATL
jgi:hypothetical protein